MSLSLFDQASPYLIQHASQPVNWLTWSESSLQKAQRENKPILLSIGYSSCHWCQEMSRNCYEDSYIASLMNRHFICILVDREENPELDHIYMEAVRMFNQSAGWPLHAFCLPDGRPFWGGTYFPKEDLGNGMAPWSQVLIRISEHYRKAKNELSENAENVIANLFYANNADYSSAKAWSNGLLGLVTDRLCEMHDHKHGGFTPPPKFPSPMKVDFLLSMRETNYLRSKSDKLEKVNHCIDRTLTSLSTSGIYDHIAGGFFRYCTDEQWTQPHYEKMLSDNALLLSTFSRAVRSKPDVNYKRVILGTISWLNETMGKPETGYASSLSAEAGGVEGAPYEWSESEMEAILGKKDSQKFFHALPTISKNNSKKLPQIIESSEISVEEQLRFFSLLRKEMEKRPQPNKDPKRLLAHNSLVISSFIQASIALNDIKLLEDAIKLEEWMSAEFVDSDNNLQSFIYPGKPKRSYANLDDYCFWVQALLDLFSLSTIIEENKSKNYLEKAIQSTEKLLIKFKDPEANGFFFTEDNQSPPLPCRKKIWYDNATPSGNSMLLRIFSTLYNLTKEKKWDTAYKENLKYYSSLAQKVPDGVSYAMSSVCDNAVGILSVQIPVNKSSVNLEFASKLPCRQTFFSFTEAKVKKYKVFNNREEVLATEEPDEVLKFLTR